MKKPAIHLTKKELASVAALGEGGRLGHKANDAQIRKLMEILGLGEGVELAPAPKRPEGACSHLVVKAPVMTFESARGGVAWWRFDSMLRSSHRRSLKTELSDRAVWRSNPTCALTGAACEFCRYDYDGESLELYFHGDAGKCPVPDIVGKDKGFENDPAELRRIAVDLEVCAGCDCAGKHMDVADCAGCCKARSLFAVRHVLAPLWKKDWENKKEARR